MRSLRVALLAPLVAFAACHDEAKPEEFQEALKYHLSQRLRASGFVVKHTDTDPRAKYPPIKLVKVAAGAAYILRHDVTFNDTPAELETWVYTSRDALIAARPAFRDDLVEDLKKDGTLFQWDAVDLPPLHAILILTSPKSALSNTFVMAMHDLTASIPEFVDGLKKKK